MIKLYHASPQILKEFVDNGEHLSSETSFVIIEDGKVLGVGGIIIMWDGVGEAWTKLLDGAIKRPVFLHKSAGLILDTLSKQFHLHRVQCLVNPIYTTHIKWAERLGFKSEGTMINYTADRVTMLRMAKV